MNIGIPKSVIESAKAYANRSPDFLDWELKELEELREKAIEAIHRYKYKNREIHRKKAEIKEIREWLASLNR